jgi:hypothetical protein
MEIAARKFVRVSTGNPVDVSVDYRTQTGDEAGQNGADRWTPGSEDQPVQVIPAWDCPYGWPSA